MDTTEVTDKGCSWSQIVDSENLTTKNKECPSKTVAIADITKIAKGKLTSPSMSKFTKSINKLNPAKLKVEPNLSAAMKRKSKIDLNGNVKKKEVLDESLESKMRQLILENQKLKLLLEESKRKAKELKESDSKYKESRQRQVTQSAGQGTPNISIKNRFDILEEKSLSATQVMEAEMAEEEERSFVQILRDKNNSKTNNNSQPLNYTQADIRSSNTHTDSQISTGHNTYTNKQDKKTIENPPSSQEKRKKPPPINIFSQDPRDTWKLANEIMTGANFHIKRVNDNKHILQIDNIDNFKKVKQALLEANTNFFSYTPKEDKNATFLLKGLNQTFETHEVMEELKRQEIQNISFNKVTRFSTRRSVQESRTLPIFLVQITADSNAAQLWKVKTLFHHIISWEKLHRKEAIQCKRCQRIGHAAANCNLKYRCVKCKEDHKPGECAAAPKDHKEVYCINCKTTGHPASYRGCPVLLELKNRLINKQHLQHQNKINSLERGSGSVRPNMSFADAVRVSTNKYEKPVIQTETHANDRTRSMKVNTVSSQDVSQIQSRLDKLENSIEIINNRLDTLTNLIMKFFSKDD